MKAITLWEPWATAIALGLKKIETRHWFTGYRGPLAIHAAKTREHADGLFEDSCNDDGLLVRSAFLDAGITSLEQLSFGCIVATTHLVACERVEGIRAALSPIERALGGYDDGRFAWRLENITRLATPVPARGGQGFWNWDDGSAPAEKDLFA